MDKCGQIRACQAVGTCLWVLACNMKPEPAGYACCNKACAASNITLHAVCIQHMKVQPDWHHVQQHGPHAHCPNHCQNPKWTRTLADSCSSKCAMPSAGSHQCFPSLFACRTRHANTARLQEIKSKQTPPTHMFHMYTDLSSNRRVLGSCRIGSITHKEHPAGSSATTQNRENEMQTTLLLTCLSLAENSINSTAMPKNSAIATVTKAICKK